MAKKKQTRRSKEKYPNLKPELNLKTRIDLTDYDYLDKLSPSELEFLNKFTGEWAGASFNSDNTKNIQKTKEHRKDSYDRNNARNRCVLTRAKATGIIDYLDDLDIANRLTEPEDKMNNMIDAKKILQEFKNSEEDT